MAENTNISNVSRISSSHPHFKSHQLRKNSSTVSGKVLRTDQDTKRDEQSRQMLRLAQGEIEELKDSLRYAEYVLARTKEEKETLEKQMSDHQQSLYQAQHLLGQKEREKQEAERLMDAATKHAEWSSV